MEGLWSGSRTSGTAAAAQCLSAHVLLRATTRAAESCGVSRWELGGEEVWGGYWVEVLCPARILLCGNVWLGLGCYFIPHIMSLLVIEISVKCDCMWHMT